MNMEIRKSCQTLYRWQLMCIRLFMENEYVRVLDVRFSPGAKAVMHSHPNHVIYVLADGKLKITTPDGKNMDVDLKKGQAIWMQAGQHAAENSR